MYSDNKILEGLDRWQLAAATETEGYIRLMAGAGSGKTRTLTRRYAYLVDTMGIHPGAVACITFTNKAAAEMRRRIRSLVGELDMGYVGTFHCLGRRICQEDISAVGYPKQFTVADREDCKALARQVMDDLGLSLKDIKMNIILDDIIAARKGRSLSYIDLLAEEDGSGLAECVANAKTKTDKIYYRYLAEQKKYFALDFDDLIYFPLYIFGRNPEVLQKWQSRMQYVMVDEFQDVDGAEYELADRLAGKNHNLFIVGDPDQTIYTWRGADVRHILNFPRDHFPCSTLELPVNYRSVGGVVDAAQSLIEKNKFRYPKKLTAVRESGVMPYYSSFGSEKDEAEFICRAIKRHIEKGERPSSIAVLYRSHHLSREIEEQLLRYNISYRVFGGVGFYERREIKDILSYLRLIAFGDDLSFKRIINVPKRGFGKTRQSALEEYAAYNKLSLFDALKKCVAEDSGLITGIKPEQFIAVIEKGRQLAEHMSVVKLIDYIMRESGYEQMLRRDSDQQRLDNLAELKQGAARFEEAEGETVFLRDYIEAISLMSDADQPEDEQSVNLMTIHNAKGLEFETVFIAGLSEGVFPSRRTDTREKMEEERRLAYVAMTRATDNLYLTDSMGAALDGNMKYPSRFIFDIGDGLLDFAVKPPEDLIAQYRRSYAASEVMLDMVIRSEGDEIEHPALGRGVIISVDKKAACYNVCFDKNIERSISFTAGFLRS